MALVGRNEESEMSIAHTLCDMTGMVGRRAGRQVESRDQVKVVVLRPKA